jgi:hypothetical protein
MNRILTTKQFISFGIPVFLIGLIAFLSKSAIFHINPRPVSIGITLDLLLTVPVTYYLLIRRTTIPKITVVPFFVIGLLIATVILPTENQVLLDFVKVWILPIIEIVLIFSIVQKVREAIKANQQNGETVTDFFTTIKNICSKLLPNYIALFLASEIAVIYYGFIQWRKLNPGRNEFTYHKNSGTIGLLITFIFLVIAETSIIHLLLARWNLLVAAWTLTALSIYTAIQLLGFLKSITLRPIAIKENKVFLRYGILSEVVVDIENIESVDMTSETIEFDNLTRSLSLFGKLEGHNIVIRLKKESIISELYGVNRKFITLALHVDNKEEFKRQIDERVIKISGTEV